MSKIEFMADNMEITYSVRRTRKETEKEYVVFKAKPFVRKSSPFYHTRTQREKEITFVCFVDGLFPLCDIGNVFDIHGSVEFNWGAMYLNVTKFYDETGKRVLRKNDEYPDCDTTRFTSF